MCLWICLNYLDSASVLSAIFEFIEEFKELKYEEIFTEEHVKKLEDFLSEEDDEEDLAVWPMIIEGLKAVISKMGHIKKSQTLYKLIK